MIYCYCESCVNHDDDDTCKLNTITISDRELTAAGFLPQCQKYLKVSMRLRIGSAAEMQKCMP